MRSIAVVGASLAGLRAVETLREEGFTGRISLIGDEPHEPYDRPPLSKQILTGQVPTANLALSKDGLSSLDLDLHLGRRAVGLDLRQRTVELDRGSEVGFDALLIATGARARRVRGVEDLDGVHVLRTLDDALAVRAAFGSKPKVVVLGAGFIGLEVAASARALGLEVTVIEATPQPLSHAIGPTMGGACVALHRDHGTRFELGKPVDAIEGHGSVERVRLADGTAIDADLVVMGIGASPATDWLEGSGLTLGNGVVCDATCATSAPGIYAAGDVAEWHNPVFDRPMRVEHWTNATQQGMAAARAMLAGPGRAAPFSSVPYFWSDQFSARIQFAGVARDATEVRITGGSVEERRFVAIYRHGARVVAALGFDSPRMLMKYRALIMRGASWDDALALGAAA
jgi:NADPH-dependent 2,4-dienoyl-CoA reductase/sulfur reductase-like enzyme